MRCACCPQDMLESQATQASQGIFKKFMETGSKLLGAFSYSARKGAAPSRGQLPPEPSLGEAIEAADDEGELEVEVFDDEASDLDAAEMIEPEQPASDGKATAAVVQQDTSKAATAARKRKVSSGAASSCTLNA